MMQHATRRSIRWVLAAAIAGPVFGLLGSQAAHGQFLVPNDGSARDANPRVGSNGKYGGTRQNGGTIVTPNQIVNGNVTNGKEFRGPTASTDARAFRGDTSTVTSDRFIRDSAGGYDNGSLADSLSTRAFYGNSRGVAPPPNYIAPNTSFNAPYLQTVAGMSQRLDASTLASYSTGDNILPKIGTTTTLLGGPLDASTGTYGSFISLSPLSGIHQNTIDASGSYILRRPDDQNGVNLSDRNGTNGDFVKQVQNEQGNPNGSNLNNPNGPNNSGPNGQGPNNSGPNNSGPNSPNGSQQPSNLQQPLNSQLQAPPESPVNQPLGSGQTSSAPLAGGQPLQSGVNTGQSLHREYTNATPTQNSQLSELQTRLQQAQGNNQPKTDQQLQKEFHDSKPATPTVPGTPNAPGTPGSPTAPGGPTLPGSALPGAGNSSLPGFPSRGAPSLAPPSTPGVKAEPLVITSLAAGVKSPTLAGVLREAELEMKQGKFASALDHYALAQSADPKDPLIFLGRANAELGASSYRTSEGHLRQAFSSNEALLMAKYDLSSMIGPERLANLLKDLKDLSAKQPKEAIAPFLLAYISYNTGREADAATYLDDVEHREGMPDALVKIMRDRWSLPSSTGLGK